MRIVDIYNLYKIIHCYSVRFYTNFDGSFLFNYTNFYVNYLHIFRKGANTYFGSQRVAGL
jgi:hypothetical protein